MQAHAVPYSVDPLYAQRFAAEGWVVDLAEPLAVKTMLFKTGIQYWIAFRSRLCVVIL